MSSRIQNLLMLLGIVLIVALGYYLYIQSNAAVLKTGTARDQVALESALILRRLNEIKTVSLDGAIFSNERFTTLVDFTEPIIPQPVGRSNPFTVN
jgi:hypothetical protein